MLRFVQSLYWIELRANILFITSMNGEIDAYKIIELKKKAIGTTKTVQSTSSSLGS